MNEHANNSAEVFDAIEARLNDSVENKWRMRCSTELRVLAPILSQVLDRLQGDQHGWILVIDRRAPPTRYVQVLASQGGALFAECVSNEFLEGSERLNLRDEELLPVLGWDWPAAPAKPNWSFHDEFLNTGSAIGLLLLKTLREVFAFEDDEILALKLFPAADQAS